MDGGGLAVEGFDEVCRVMSTFRYGTAPVRPRRDVVLFLDWDGVINSQAWQMLNQGKNFLRTFDPACVARVAEICARTGCSIVVSSQGRINKTLSEMREILIESGFPPPCPITGATPKDFSYPEPRSENERGYAIKAWLAENPRVKTFCVLDDEDVVPLREHQVRTSFYEGGLQDEHVEAVVKMLGGG